MKLGTLLGVCFALVAVVAGSTISLEGDAAFLDGLPGEMVSRAQGLGEATFTGADELYMEIVGASLDPLHITLEGIYGGGGIQAVPIVPIAMDVDASGDIAFSQTVIGSDSVNLDSEVTFSDGIYTRSTTLSAQGDFNAVDSGFSWTESAGRGELEFETPEAFTTTAFSGDGTGSFFMLLTANGFISGQSCLQLSDGSSPNPFEFIVLDGQCF